MESGKRVKRGREVEAEVECGGRVYLYRSITTLNYTNERVKGFPLSLAQCTFASIKLDSRVYSCTPRCTFLSIYTTMFKNSVDLSNTPASYLVDYKYQAMFRARDLAR